MNIAKMDLQYFADEAAAAPAEVADPGTAAEGGPESFNVGDELADGTKVESAQVAAALNRQMKRHPELRKVYGQRQNARPAQQPAGGPEQTPNGEPTLQDRWNELRKGEFKDLYAQDVQAAIKDRFKNQEDATGKLNAMQPMLDALMKKVGVDNVEELQNIILDDDSLYEEEAEAAGMTVSAYKSFKKLQDEHDQMVAKEQENMEHQMFRDHISKLIQQGEQLKQVFPGFDFDTEMQNPQFRKLTSPEIGLSVEDAFHAIHHNELNPQLMQYGMERARQQMGQTIQAQQARPAEGAMRNQGQKAADVRLDPNKLTRPERDALRKQIHMGKVVSFD